MTPPTASHRLTLTRARRLALHAQGLDGRMKLPRGHDGIAGIIERLGYIQIDTIAVIERAHHHTLGSRRPDYHPDMLHRLQAVDRRVFEYWGHAASYLPMSDYRHYLPRMRAFRDPHTKWEKERLEKYGHLMPEVLERIRRDGPLSSRDFAPPADRKRRTWWGWRPTKVALELLFWRGELMITERRNFTRVYDLTERVLPDIVDTRLPDVDETGRFFVRRALQAYGIATRQEIAEHIRGTDNGVIETTLADLIAAGEVVSVTIAGDNTACFALTEMLETASRLRQTAPRMHILSPFDNLIIQRKRTARLFGFDYTLECYVPAPKRVYGYFVLPILWGESFVGRLDAKAVRGRKVLVVRSLLLEDLPPDTDACLAALADKLRAMATRNGCEHITLERCRPAPYKKALARLLA